MIDKLMSISFGASLGILIAIIIEYFIDKSYKKEMRARGFEK